MTIKVQIELQNGYTGTTTIRELAELVYYQVYKGIDDKDFRKTKTPEIVDWLSDGDLRDKPSLEALSAGWLEYDQEPGRGDI